MSLEGVWAREAGAPKSVKGGVADLRLQRGSGLLAILGGVEDGARALCEVLGGQRKPDKGRVLFGGREPHRDAGLRARMGYLGHTPQLVPGARVFDSMSLALAARHEAGRDPGELLRAFGIGNLLGRTLRSLSFGEARAVELALALSLDEPEAVVLFDPFTEVSGVGGAAVFDRLRSLAERTVVCVITGSPADAKKLCGAPWDAPPSGNDLLLVLHRGGFARAGEPGGWLVFAHSSEMSVWIDAGLRTFVEAVSKHPDVSGVAWESTSSTRSDGGTVRVRGADPRSVALLIADVATTSGAEITGISEIEPTLAEVRNTTEVIRHGSHVKSQSQRVAGQGALRFPADTAAARAESVAEPAADTSPRSESEPRMEPSLPAEAVQASSPDEPPKDGPP